MADKEDLITAITLATRGEFKWWTVGITGDLSTRRSQHGNPKFFYYWKADSEQVAREVESYFISEGMKGGVGGDIDGRKQIYVYIFLKLVSKKG